MTNIVKDIFIFVTEDIQKHSNWSWKSADTAKTSSNFEKKNSEYQSQISFRKSHQSSWNIDELLKRYKAKIPGAGGEGGGGGGGGGGGRGNC